MRKFAAVCIPVFVLCLCTLIGRGCKAYYYHIECTQQLTRAADAPTVDLAVSAIDKAIAYLDDNNKTTGNSGFIFKTPRNDVEYWYGQLVSSRDELVTVSDKPDPLLHSNMLMKLRETLSDSGQHGRAITQPANMDVYPNHVGWTLATYAAIVIGFVCILVFFAAIIE